MPTDDQTRRSFLKSSAFAAGICAASPLPILRAADSTTTDRTIRVGAPIFNGPTDPEALALEHRKRGMRAAYCPHVQLDQRERIREIEKAFQKHDVVIAEVGRWKNLLAQNQEERTANHRFVTDGLALADEIGALCCVDIAGSYNPDSWFGPHPENLSQRHFDEAVENARTIIDAVKPKRARFCYEMMGWALPDSPESYARMIKAVDRKAFGVHLDPANLVNSPARFYNNTKLLDDCFDQLGPWIVSCHAKDVAWNIEMQIHFQEVVLGKGKLDYITYLQRLAQLPHDVPLMIEHLKTEAEYETSRQYIFEQGQLAGVRF